MVPAEAWERPSGFFGPKTLAALALNPQRGGDAYSSRFTGRRGPEFRGGSCTDRLLVLGTYLRFPGSLRHRRGKPITQFLYDHRGPVKKAKEGLSSGGVSQTIEHEGELRHTDLLE
jgi:hypothetical protein